MAPETSTQETARPNAYLLYSQTWTRTIDLVFIDELVEFAALNNRPLGQGDSMAISYAQLKVNAIFNTNFMYCQCLNRFTKLQKRYLVFDFITNLSSIYYDETNNTVHAFEIYIWEYLALKYKLVEAYMNEGEPAWPSLCKIFGRASVLSPLRQVEIIEQTSAPKDSIPIPEDMIQIPRETFQMNNANNLNKWWKDMAKADYDHHAKSSHGAYNSSGDHSRGRGSEKILLMPRNLFPINEKIIYQVDDDVDEYCVPDYFKHDNDRTSSVNGPPCGKGKEKMFVPKGIGGSGV